MRALLAASLVVASGCNQIFGLNGNLVGRDGAVDGLDAEWPKLSLTWMLVEDTSGTISFPPIAGATVEVGPIDPADGPLQPVPIEPTGDFHVAPALIESGYRLVYTVDSLATEIQGKLATGRFVVPLVGRTARTPTPVDATIVFDPAGGGSLANARVATVGLWTRTTVDTGLVIPPYKFNYQKLAATLSGAQGSLSDSTGDVEVLMEVGASGEVTRYAYMSVANMVAGPTNTTTATTSPYMVTPISSVAHNFDPGGPTGGLGRLQTAIPGGTPGTTAASLLWAGVIPSPNMPAFIDPRPGTIDENQLIPLGTDGSTNPIMFVNPFAGGAIGQLQLAAHAEQKLTRMAGSLPLTMGFQSIAIPTMTVPTANIQYDVGIAHVTGHDPTLTPVDGSPVVLNTSSPDGVGVPVGNARIVDLSFGTDRPVDDCVTTLYQVMGASLFPVRRLLMRQPPDTVAFRIDASVFTHGTTYVFGIVCRIGQPRVKNDADYSVVSYPYQTSTLYTRTFTIQ